MKKIPLTQGKFALVDDEDFERVSKYKWCADRHDRGNVTRWYAQRRVRLKNGKTKTQRLHKFILLGVGEVDHRDCDGLNNRRRNLRPATRSQNNCNSRRLTAKSGFRGVYWDKGSKKWRAKITLGNKEMYVGIYADKKSAALAYDGAATRLFGEFALTNKKLKLLC